MEMLQVAFIMMQIAIAIIALNSRDLMVAVVLFAAFSFCSAGVFVLMKSVDVGFVEAIIGAIITVYFITIFYHMERRSSP
jgi:multicomponent Na+:H+ antiporter subunit B